MKKFKITTALILVLCLAMGMISYASESISNNNLEVVQESTPEVINETPEPTPQPTLEPTQEPTQEPTPEPTPGPTTETTPEPTPGPTDILNGSENPEPETPETPATPGTPGTQENEDIPKNPEDIQDNGNNENIEDKPANPNPENNPELGNNLPSISDNNLKDENVEEIPSISDNNLENKEEKEEILPSISDNNLEKIEEESLSDNSISLSDNSVDPRLLIQNRPASTAVYKEIITYGTPREVPMMFRRTRSVQLNTNVEAGIQSYGRIQFSEDVVIDAQDFVTLAQMINELNRVAQ